MIDNFKQISVFSTPEHSSSIFKRIINACKEHGVKEPVFEEFQHGFRVALFKEKLNEGVNGGVNEGVNEGVKKLLDIIVKYPNHRTPFYADRMKTSVKNIERWLKVLKAEEKIAFRGAPKTGGYFAIKNEAGLNS